MIVLPPDWPGSLEEYEAAIRRGEIASYTTRRIYARLSPEGRQLVDQARRTVGAEPLGPIRDEGNA
jgi:hypothetical protein